MVTTYRPLLSPEDLAIALDEGHAIQCNSWGNMAPECGGEPKFGFIGSYYDSPTLGGWIPDYEGLNAKYGCGWNEDEGRFNMAIRAVIVTEDCSYA